MCTHDGDLECRADGTHPQPSREPSVREMHSVHRPMGRGAEKQCPRALCWATAALAISLMLILLAGCERRQGSSPDRVRSTSSASTTRAMPTTSATTTATAAATSSATGLHNAGALPEATPPPEVYAVQRGDTLSAIAHRFGCDLKTLISDNGISNPNTLKVGQKIELSTCQFATGPSFHLLPDSEFVNSPAYVDFDVSAFAAAQGGYLAEYYENVGGKLLSGAEIVSLVAHHYSVGPRTMLAILELKSGWVTNPKPPEQALSYPMGYKGGGWELLSRQLAWAADRLNKGYYDWRGRGISPIVWRDGTVIRYDPTLNAATAGLQYFFSLGTGRPQWETWVGKGPDSFVATYRQLFGDPDQYAIEPLIPDNTELPPLSLPWTEGELWYYTGGPHGGWGDGSAWAALDFVPGKGAYGCQVASSWATAAAAGLVVYSDNGEVVIDLDKDGHEETGWVLFYLHVAARDRVPVGTLVQRGDQIGHPSCEGGMAEATHLHFARRYNGEWIAADGPLPLILSGWQAHSGGEPYEGTVTRGSQERTACECRNKEYNGLVAGR